MELRSKIEAALKEHGPMTVGELRKHVKCSWLAKLCSNLTRHGVIRKLGGGTRSGIYGLPGQASKEAKGEPSVKAPRKAPRAKPRQMAPEARAPRNGNGHAAFAINEDGQLGIEKDGTKLSLDGQEFERLRSFIERTEPVWKGA